MIWIENRTDLLLLDYASGELFLAVQRGQVLPSLRKVGVSSVPIPSKVVNEVDSFVASSCSSGIRLVSFEKDYRNKIAFIVVREFFGGFDCIKIPVSFSFKFHLYLDVKCSSNIQLVDYDSDQTWEFSLDSRSVKKIFEKALVRIGNSKLIWDYDSGNYFSVNFSGFSYFLTKYDKCFLISSSINFAVLHVLKKDLSKPNCYQEDLLIVNFRTSKVGVVASDLGVTVVCDASNVWNNERYFFMFLSGCEGGFCSSLLIFDIYNDVFFIIKIEDSSFFDFESFASFFCDKSGLFLISSNGETMKVFDDQDVLVPELEENASRLSIETLNSRNAKV